MPALTTVVSKALVRRLLKALVVAAICGLSVFAFLSSVCDVLFSQSGFGSVCARLTLPEALLSCLHADLLPWRSNVEAFQGQKNPGNIILIGYLQSKQQACLSSACTCLSSLEI